MKLIQNKAFTLVELLVVITILAILSVTAYQSFGGATDKAQNTTKKSNIILLGNTLWTFKTTENHFPMPQAYSATNLWGYDNTKDATESNTIKVVYADQEISTLSSDTTSIAGWWIIYGTGSWAKGQAEASQIGAKWVLGINGKFNKKYLKEEVYDNQLWDITLTGETDKKMINYWIGKFTYAVYARHSKVSDNNWNTSGTRWQHYSLAATFTDLEWEWYKTFLIGDYSKDNFNNPTNYPEYLFGLKQDQKDNNVATTVTEQGIPYPINNFAK